MSINSLETYLDSKQNYENEGYKIFWIFEATYLDELKDLYQKKMIGLEKKLIGTEENSPYRLGQYLMCAYCQKKFNDVYEGVKIIQVASNEGFSKANILFKEVSTDESKKIIKQRFLDEFKRIIGNKDIIPDKSLIIINSEQEGLNIVKRGTDENKYKLNSKMKKRDKASQVKGQTTVTDFFQSTKSPSSSKPYQKKIEENKSTYEGIAKMLRGENVKVLKIPKNHYELDPSNYVSVFLLHSITLRAANDQNGLVLMTHCQDALERLPNEVWAEAINQVEKCEDNYLKVADSSDKSATSDELEAEVLTDDNNVTVKPATIDSRNVEDVDINFNDDDEPKP